jgi:hypothetical protein
MQDSSLVSEQVAQGFTQGLIHLKLWLSTHPEVHDVHPTPEMQLVQAEEHEVASATQILLPLREYPP